MTPVSATAPQARPRRGPRRVHIPRVPGGDEDVGLLLQAGWTMQGIADALGTLLRSVHRWRSGDTAPDHRYKLALRTLVRQERANGALPASNTPGY